MPYPDFTRPNPWETAPQPPMDALAPPFAGGPPPGPPLSLPVPPEWQAGLLPPPAPMPPAPSLPAAPPAPPPQVDAVSDAQGVSPRQVGNKPGQIPPANADVQRAKGPPRSPWDMQRDAANMETQARTQDVEAQTGILGKLAEDQHAQAAKIYQMQQQHAADRMDALAKYNAANDALAAQKEDPNRWGKNLSQGQQILGIVSAGLAGFLHPDGENSAVKMMQQAIDRDIAAQRSDMANKREALAGKMNALGQLTEIYGSQEAAEEHLRASMLDDAKTQLQAQAAKSQSPIAQANNLRMQAGIDQEQQAAAGAAQAAYQKYLDTQRELANNEYKAHTDRSAVGVQRARLAEERRQFNITQPEQKRQFDEKLAAERDGDAAKLAAEQAKARGEADKTTRQLMIYEGGDPIVNEDGSPMLGRNVEAAASLSTKLADYKSGLYKLQRYKQLAAESAYHGWGPNSERAKQADALREELITDWAHGHGLGAISGGDRVMAETAIAGPNSWTSTDPTGRLDQLIKIKNKEIDEAMGANGYKGSYSKKYRLDQDAFTPGGIAPGTDVPPTDREAVANKRWGAPGWQDAAKKADDGIPSTYVGADEPLIKQAGLVKK